MRLEDVTAEIRPRGRWESIDLGCALVRENFGKVLMSWIVTVVPLWFLVISVYQLWPWPEGRPWMALLTCWWLLPVCDRVPLFVISRALFGEDVKLREVFKAWPRMLFKRSIKLLTLERFSPGRGLAQPVLELEGLKGSAYRSRVNLLARNGGEGATQAILISWVLVLCSMFSAWFIYLSFMGLFGDNVEIEEFWVKHVLATEASFVPAYYIWVLLGLYLMSVTLIQPFFVGAGFAMYINSRTITEGWDIELAFKRMSERVSSSGLGIGSKIASLLIAGASFLMLGGNALSQEKNERLEKVVADERFTIHTEEYEHYVSDDHVDLPDGDIPDMSGFAVIGNLLFWVILGVAIAGIVWLIYQNRHVFSGGKSIASQANAPSIKTVMGMEVTLESLPDDVVKAAHEAWRLGEHQKALSLLYRGSIAWLVNYGQVQIGEGDTERDCELAVEKAQAGDKARYFSRLTIAWVRLAYGKIKPSEDEFHSLCRDWMFSSKPVERLGAA